MKKKWKWLTSYDDSLSLVIVSCSNSPSSRLFAPARGWVDVFTWSGLAWGCCRFPTLGRWTPLLDCIPFKKQLLNINKNGTFLLIGNYFVFEIILDKINLPPMIDVLVVEMFPEILRSSTVVVPPIKPSSPMISSSSSVPIK